MIRGSETAIGRRAMWRRCWPPSTTASSDVRTRSPTRSLCSALAVSRWRVALAIWLKVVCSIADPSAYKSEEEWMAAIEGMIAEPGVEASADGEEDEEEGF